MHEASAPPLFGRPLATAPDTILVFTSSDLVGDGLIKYPFVQAVRAAWPAAHVTWVTGNGESAYKDVLAPLVAGLIDEVISNAGIGLGWHQLCRRPLKGRHFDLVIDAQRRVPASCHIRRVPHGTFVSGAFGFLLSDIVPRRPFAKPPRFIDQLLRLVAVASGRPAQTGQTPRLDPAMRDLARRLLPPAGGPYLGLAPGARGIHKCWPRDRFVALARAVAQDSVTPVFLLGPMEADQQTQLAAGVEGALFPLQDRAAIQAFGTTPLLTIAVAEHLDAALANDSGTSHMIALADRPLVSLFGPTSPAKFAPAARRLTVIRAQDFGGREMTDIPFAPVLDRVREALG